MHNPCTRGFAEKARYDHHQRGFDECFGHGFTTKLSSAGLVYKHYGEGIVAGLMDLPPTHPDVRTVYLAVYKKFMEAVDAIDNGVNQWDGAGPPRYISRTDLGSRVANLNPNWNDEDQSGEEGVPRLGPVSEDKGRSGTMVDVCVGERGRENFGGKVLSVARLMEDA